LLSLFLGASFEIVGFTGVQNQDTQTAHPPALELADRPDAVMDTAATNRSRKVSDDHVDTGDVHKSSHQDVDDMHRMGKQQILVRRFRQITIAAFIGTTTCAWEYALFLISPGLIDGGTAGLLYNVLWSFFGFGTIYLSLAEMASMAPIAGSLYHWVSEFALEDVQGILSYITG
jgi:amino acid permease